ncbi:hypothetical protein DFQ28_000874 [Apophysomyces sp. BC1034]|nr:hypothetical protein DFQ30_000835 [Apophysomyces sp. BC1015]KAG0181733.1 hypothetical protein DFQ29_007278 [Apophysomyces sp. BC1021]KAG0191126.1 hypothetical protein DFQ28_000874 [Apophysomyces sp. BC1034]
MEAQRIREGVKLMQEGDKASSKGLFRKPDWDIAAGCYERAAVSFKIAKSYDQAVQAYAKASEALFKADAIHLAGKAMENAALVLAQNLNQPQRAAEAYQRASDLFMTQGSIDRAAEQLEKAGRAMENTDINAAIEMYSSACTLYEQEDRGRFAIEIFKKAISLLIKSKKYEKAVDMLHRQSQTLKKMASRSHLYKANLSIMIVLFAIGDDVEAGKQFNSMCDPGFMLSEEAEICQCLLQAYNEGNQELLEATVRRQHVSFLDNEVAKLARTLTVPGEVLSGGHQHSQPAYHVRDRTQSSPRPTQASGTGDVHTMSPAQVRAELYSRPAKQEPPKDQEKEKEACRDAFEKMNIENKPQPYSAPAPAPPPYHADHEEEDEDSLR